MTANRSSTGAHVAGATRTYSPTASTVTTPGDRMQNRLSLTLLQAFPFIVKIYKVLHQILVYFTLKAPSIPASYTYCLSPPPTLYFSEDCFSKASAFLFNALFCIIRR